MLACARRRVQSVLPRPFAFSTTVPKKNEEIPASVEDTDAMKVLSSMLHKTGDGVSPIIPGGTNHRLSEQRWIPFKPNRVINPVDLTYQTRTYQQKRSKRPNVAPPSSICRYYDPFHQLDLDPRDFTANNVVLSEYLSEMGKLQSRAQTYLTAKNQRLLAKTIRRAKMMGIIPHLSIPRSVEKKIEASLNILLFYYQFLHAFALAVYEQI